MDKINKSQTFNETKTKCFNPENDHMNRYTYERKEKV